MHVDAVHHAEECLKQDPDYCEDAVVTLETGMGSFLNLCHFKLIVNYLLDKIVAKFV